MPRPLSVTDEPAVGAKLDLDEGGVAGQRLVHGIVDHLGEQVMQRLFVGAADIHAGAAADRLEPLQHLDMMRRIAALGATAARGAAACGGARRFAAGACSNRSPLFWVFFSALAFLFTVRAGLLVLAMLNASTDVAGLREFGR